jgi:NADH-quinone oxidoreductase subunit G
MSSITITIDGKVCEAKEGEFILNVARANNIFIPAICYLTRCTPSLACRLCLVEADGKQVYACNAKSKDGMVVNTITENIATERKAIMEVYDVNHPLQCGVCDQSGECELQNYTLELETNQQTYSVKDVARPTQDWGHLKYDPGLCIVCERCVSVCKDVIGDAALKTVKRGADALDKDFKESMPKDAYAMWNKLNKSLIGANAGETLDCTSCGECSAVCPTGAIVGSNFQYKSNAWELDKIPATCAHCSVGCAINYEVKHTNIADSTRKIYRVTNEFHYVSLCGSGRYGFDFENDAIKDESEFNSAIEAFKKADTIKFSSIITNEEALILQKLKEKYGYKLVNEDALRFKKFMESYSSITGNSLYSGTLDDVSSSNFVISIGSALKTDSPNSRYAFNNAISMNKGSGLYFHPMGDPVVEGFGKKGKTIETIYHKPLAEEAVLYLILDLFANKQTLPETVANYIDSFYEKRTRILKETVKEKVVKKVKDPKTGEEVDKPTFVNKVVEKEVEINYSKILDLVGLDENFYDLFESMMAKKDSFALVLGEDIITHPQSTNLAKLAGLIELYTEFKVVVIPSNTNTLGVSLICDLDESCGEYTIGYNEYADFNINAFGNGNLDMPAINQQEGTFTNINKKVVPTNAALPYGGYTLNDIASALGVESEFTINYTKSLPTSKGFKEVEFDDLPNYFTNSCEEVRGYSLDVVATDKSEPTVNSISEFKSMDGLIIYMANPVKQFNHFTNRCEQLTAKSAIYLSEDLAKKLELNNSSVVAVSTELNSVNMAVEIDNKISGDIAYVSTFDKNIDSKSLFGTYRFIEAKIEGV